MARRGLTLIEILVTTALMLVATGLVAGLAGDLGHTLRFGSQADRALEAAQVGLAQMRAEAQEAVDFLIPDRSGLTFPQGTPNDRLEFTRLDPAALRLPSDPLPPPGSWDPFLPAHLMQVSYSLAGDELVRDAGGQVTTLAEGVAGLKVSFDSPTLLSMTLTVERGESSIDLSGRAYLLVEADQ